MTDPSRRKIHLANVVIGLSLSMVLKGINQRLPFLYPSQKFGGGLSWDAFRGKSRDR
jgi:hypothetical protein